MSFFLFLFFFIVIKCQVKIESNNNRNLQDDGFSDLRLVYDINCIRNSVTSTETYTLEKGIQNAQQTIQKLVKVQRYSEVISPQSYIKNFPIEFSENRGCTGLNQEYSADLFVSIKFLEDVSDIGFAKPSIVQTLNNNRPIIGTIIYNRKFVEDLNLDDKEKIQVISIIFLHEFTHILGFSKDILQKKYLLYSIPNRRNRMNANTQNKLYVNGTKVKEIAKKYFNCPDLVGVELEDAVISKENMIHWNQRILLGDYMISEFYFSEQAISEITLALLEDLGYKVNYYTGGLMRFGKHRGCEFLRNDCVQQVYSTYLNYLNSSFPNEFCSNAIYYGDDILNYGLCSPGRQSMSYCRNYVSSEILGDFNRGGKRIHGYSDKYLIEYCPISYDVNLESASYPRIYYGGNCKLGNKEYGQSLTFWGSNVDKHYSTISDDIAEKYSEKSYCVFSSLLKQGSNNKDYIKNILRPTCYAMSCSEKSLTINIDTEYVVCPREGGIIKIENTYSGFLICPDYNLICTGTGTGTGNEICNNIFDCVDNKISYKDSTFTYDYTQSEYVSSEITNCDDKSITNYATNVYELGDGGICPKYCSQCSEKGRCNLCAGNYSIYIGNKEGDDEPINCTDKIPEHGYYLKSSQDGKNYYYRCIDFCYVCFADKKEECYQCAPTHKLTNDSRCEPRIPGCNAYDTSKTILDTTSNNGYPSYNECLNCDNENFYYCFDMDRTKCVEDKAYNKTLYYDMEDKSNPCIQKCENRFMNCESCNNNTCITCNKSNHFINNFGDCIPKIENCQVHNKSLNTSSCEICEENENYYCVDDNRTYCEYISPSSIKSYNKTTNNQNSCYKLCNITFGDKCLECEYNSCKKCIEGYFVGYDGRCYENMTGCINNKLINPAPLSRECDECDNSSNYYCINQTRTECTNITEKGINISYYYKYSDISYPCYGLCEERIKNCIRCNSKYCFECSGNFTVNRKRTNCSYFSNYFRDDEKCRQIIYPNPDYENLNKSLDFDDLILDYFENLEHISKVEHYVGKDYLMTLYINSSCTDGLLSEGYYSIDSRELNNTIIDSTEGVNYHLFGVYINHNYRSYLKFYELDNTGKEPIDFNTDCPNCIGKNYYMTHNLYYILKDIIGTPFTEIVIEKEINIFDPNDDIYTDRCTNMTLFEIDIPIHLRKNYLLLDEFNIDALMCRDMDCEIIEYNFKNRTSKCQCPVRRNMDVLDYLFEENDIKYTLSKKKEKAKGISEAAKAISCTKEGLKYSNFKNNDAAILILVFFIIQFVCYIAYGCFGKPIANISSLPSVHTLANPPKLEDKSRLYLFADWNTDLSNIVKKEEEPVDEQEKVIQPRDDSGDQIMEEEKSLNNDFFSDISIDTNAGGLLPDKRTNRSLRALEKSKRVLILLGNKLQKKVSVENSSNQEEAVSDSDELPSPKRRKIDNSNFWKNYWLFLSIKQHIINYFSELTFCNITISYIPLELRFVRSIFLFILSIIITILWLDQKYFEKKWEHFNDKYSLSTTSQNDLEISLGERIGYALGTNFGYVIVNLIFLIVADFITGVIFFNLRSDVEKILDKGKMSKMQDYILKVRRNYNIFYAANFILIIIFFLSLCGFGVAYPGGVVDCLTVALFSVFFFEIVPFVWSLILAALRYYGYKKKKQNMIKFSEYFLY